MSNDSRLQKIDRAVWAFMGIIELEDLDLDEAMEALGRAQSRYRWAQSLLTKANRAGETLVREENERQGRQPETQGPGHDRRQPEDEVRQSRCAERPGREDQSPRPVPGHGYLRAVPAQPGFAAWDRAVDELGEWPGDADDTTTVAFPPSLDVVPDAPDPDYDFDDERVQELLEMDRRDYEAAHGPHS